MTFLLEQAERPIKYENKSAHVDHPMFPNAYMPLFYAPTSPPVCEHVNHLLDVSVKPNLNPVSTLFLHLARLAAVPRQYPPKQAPCFL